MATESIIAQDYIQPESKQQMENAQNQFDAMMEVGYQEAMAGNGYSVEEAFSRIHAELEKGYADMQAGRTVSADQAFADIYAEFGI